MSTVISPQFEQGSGDHIEAELKALYDLADSAHEEVQKTRHWDRCRAAYAGKLYEGLKMPGWKARGCHPKINEVVESFAATLTDQEPKFVPKRRHLEDSQLGSIFFEASDYEWERQRMQSKMMVIARALLTDGGAFLYTGIDHEQNLFTRPISSYAYRPDPAAESDLDLTYGIVDTTMSKAEIEAAFPDVAQDIFDTVNPSSRASDGNKAVDKFPGRTFGPVYSGTVTDSSGTDRPTQIISTQQNSTERHTDRYRVREFSFTKGGERELRLVMDDKEEQVVEMPGSKGRRCILIENHYFEALDTDSPFIHGQVPVTNFPCITLQGEYFGYSYIYPLIDTAEQIADLDNQILNNIKLMLNPAWLVPIESRVDPKKFYGSPAMVIPYRFGFKPEPHIPPALPQYVFELRRLKQQEFDTASGLSDISRGTFSGGLDDVSGKAVALLQKPQYRRMRPIQRSVEEGLPRWGYQTLCNAIQTYQPEKWARILPEEMAQQVPMFPWFQAGYQGPLDEFVPEIKMEAGSNLPPDSEAKASLAFNLYDRQTFGPPGSQPASTELLKAVDWPDAEKVAAMGAQAVMQQQMLQAAQAQEMAAQKAGPPPQGGQNKALGGVRSPESDQAVMGDPSGQEVGA